MLKLKHPPVKNSVIEKDAWVFSFAVKKLESETKEVQMRLKRVCKPSSAIVR